MMKDGLPGRESIENTQKACKRQATLGQLMLSCDRSQRNHLFTSQLIAHCLNQDPELWKKS